MAKECDNQMYEIVCKERFDDMKELQQETLRILKGKNSDPGLVDDVRALKKAHKRIVGGGIFILCAFALQIVRVISDWISGVPK